MQALTENQIRASFRGATGGERSRLRIPEPASIPWTDIDFLGWIDRSDPATGYLVASIGDAAVGLILSATKPSASTLRQSMCNLCRTIHEQGGVALFTTPKWGEAGKRGSTIGDYICADLACSEYLRGTKRSGVVQLPDTLLRSERIERLKGNLVQFIERVRQN